MGPESSLVLIALLVATVVATIVALTVSLLVAWGLRARLLSNAVGRLREILAAALLVDSAEKCRELNNMIDAWNSIYVPRVVDTPLPKVDCSKYQ